MNIPDCPLLSSSPSRTALTRHLRICSTQHQTLYHTTHSIESCSYSGYLHVSKLVLEVEDAVVGLECLSQFSHFNTHLQHNKHTRHTHTSCYRSTQAKTYTNHTKVAIMYMFPE